MNLHLLFSQHNLFNDVFLTVNFDRCKKETIWVLKKKKKESFLYYVFQLNIFFCIRSDALRYAASRLSQVHVFVRLDVAFFFSPSYENPASRTLLEIRNAAVQKKTGR